MGALASHGHVGMRPGTVADFVGFGDALDERGVSCDPNHRRRSAAIRFERSAARRSDGGRVSLVCAVNTRLGR